MYATIIVVAVIVIFGLMIVAKSVALIPQAEAAVIERLGRYTHTVSGQLAWMIPFVDRIRDKVDLRERVVSFPPQPVITEDNLTVNIDTVVYFQVTDPRSAVYEINDYIVGVEQLTTTTLRNVVGGMDLEETLTSRERINTKLRAELDTATGRWGLRVARVELKAIIPPPSIQESMEKQMKADREKRATILSAEAHRESAIKSAEGDKQSRILAAEASKQAAILEAEGDRQSLILQAEGERAAQYLRAQGKAKSIEKTFAAIRSSKPTPELLAYEYLQTLPDMANGQASKVWVVPNDFGSALKGFARSFGVGDGEGNFHYEMPDVGDVEPVDEDEISHWFEESKNQAVAQAVADAEAVARKPVDVPGTQTKAAAPAPEPAAPQAPQQVAPPAQPPAGEAPPAPPAPPAGQAPPPAGPADSAPTESMPPVPPQQAYGQAPQPPEPGDPSAGAEQPGGPGAGRVQLPKPGNPPEAQE